MLWNNFLENDREATATAKQINTDFFCIAIPFDLKIIVVRYHLVSKGDSEPAFEFTVK